MVFKENGYIWKITFLDPDDGYRNVHSYWTNFDKAHAKAATLPKNQEATVIQDTLYEDDDGNYYKIEYKEVNVDVPTPDEVLAKLSPKERKVLGF